jgi:hypothetical protein
MPIIEKQFSGVMNLDDRNDILPSSHHKDAKNVVFRGNPGLMQAQNIYGTRLINNANLRSGTNICIGSFYDSLKNRVFYFVYNIDPSDGKNYNAIFMYDVNTGGAPVRLLMSHINSTVELFGFNTSYPITSVNILYRPDSEGDVLFWTDGLNRPKKLNILEATSSPKKYGNTWLPVYLTVAQNTPSSSPICRYIDDSSTAINNLKNRLFQFAYRYIYYDNTKSVFSPWSRLFTPANADALATEKDPLKNNVIQIQYNSGPLNVKSIEIVGRISLDDTFGDAFSIATLNKDTLFIVSNSNQTYNFYNSEAYQFLDPTETTLLYSLIPIKANAQELLNGNTLIYGGITEGLDFDTVMNVTSSVSLVTNSITSPFTFFEDNDYVISYDPVLDTLNYVSGYFYILFQGTPNVGDTYTLTLRLSREDPMLGTRVYANATVTIGPLAVGQDNFAYIETQLKALLQANTEINTFDLDGTIDKLTGTNPVHPGKYGVRIGGSNFSEAWVEYVDGVQYIYNTPALPADPTGVNSACYKHNARYGFGLVYFTEFGETDGVHTVNTMNILTPQITSATVGANPLTIPAIQFNISHPPPSWAKYYSFVRTANLSVSNLFTIFTTNAYKDADYAYLDITAFQNNTNGYTKYSFTKGDRVRLVGLYNNSASVTDYPILDVVTTFTIAPSPAVTGVFIKLQYDASTMSSFTTGQKWYLEVYTPPKNTTESGAQVYYEFGETYPIGLDVNSNRVHLAPGQTQSQIIGAGAQPAIFKFYRGEVYTRQRGVDWIIDKAMSDRFPSQVDGVGRPFVIDPSAKQTYYSTLVRYSLPYSQGTTINDTNVFFPANYDEYDRAKGDIRRLKVRGSQMRVFQSRAVGVAGVFENMIFNADGSDNLIQTNKILNQIHYYQGSYGMGWMSTSLASSANADYFVDPVRGYQLRVSQDGITPISEIYKAQFYVTDLATQYVKPVAGALGGQAKVLGVYDFFEEEYISVFQPTASRANVTLAFNEKRNCYSSFYDYSPEAINNIEGKVISFRSGNLYVHDDTINYNRFYGTQYPSSVTFVFNEQGVIKKDYNAITQDSNVVWTSPTLGDVNTALSQDSNLVASDYVRYEGLFNAAFMRDGNSLGGLVEGDYLKGVWLETKFSNTSSNLVYLSGIYINYTPSQRNL